MAQASSNAQREPSMEEILASIRRIIEDSDTGEESAGSGNSQESATTASVEEVSEETAEPSTMAANPETGEEVTAESSAANFESITGDDIQAASGEEPAADKHEDAEVSSFRAELTADDETDEASQPADSSMNALSLADIQAEVAKQVSTEEPEFAGAEIKEQDSGPLADAKSENESADEATAAPVEEAFVAETEAETPADDEQSGGGSLAELAESIMSEDMDAMREGLTGPSTEVSQQETAEDSQFSAHAPIISEQAGRQVAAAFDELSDAFSQTRQKSFDEMAEDMMRPMLQDWLDNNLPVLVERLVREEIDRVARGASRS